MFPFAHFGLYANHLKMLLDDVPRRKLAWWAVVDIATTQKLDVFQRCGAVCPKMRPHCRH